MEKRIYFYRIFFRNDGHLVEPRVVFTHINSLPFNENGRYLALDDGNMRSMFVDSTSSPFKIRIGTIRRRGLPLVETRGRTKPLVISPESGLYEPMHFVIFPNNIVGFESNFYGPRPTSLRLYIPSKADGIVDEVELIPLIRRDVHELLSRVGEIRTFRLKVNRDMMNLLRELDDNLPDAFSALRQTTDAEYIEVILRAEKYSRTGITLSFRDRLANWISKAEVREGVDTLKIRARDEASDEIKEFDLLQEYLLSLKHVETQDEVHRSVDRVSMYRAINQAYNELRQEIYQMINEGA